MKRIAALLVALALISTTSGCGCCRWLWPGSHVAPPVITQYAPACNTCNSCPTPACDSCGGGAPVGTPYGAGYGGTTVYDGGYNGGSGGYFPQ